MKTSRFEEQYQESGFESQRRYPNESLIGFLAKHFFSIPKDQRRQIKILELGCGSGANLWLIAQEGFESYGIDFAETGLTYCQKMLNQWQVTAQLQQADMQKLPYPDDYFDAIVDVVSMQHLTLAQHEKTYREVYRCLKPAGRFFSYHLGQNSVSFSQQAEKLDNCTIGNIPAGLPLANNGQTCFLSTDIVKSMLSDSGLVKTSVELLTRSYAEQSQFLEYLIIEAQKP